MNAVVITVYIVWNVLVLLLYGLDKVRAKTGAWRVPEKTLLACAVLLGAFGAFLGMQIFRHKTRNAKFKILVPILFILNLVLLATFGFAPGIVTEMFAQLDKVRL